MKYIFLSISIIISSVMLHSQYLNANDIDIFIENHSTLTVGEMRGYSGREWEEYKDSINMLYENTWTLIDSLSETEKHPLLIRAIRIHFLEVINSPIPPDKQKVYEGVGWLKDGNKKYYIIQYSLFWLEKQQEIKFFIDAFERMLNEGSSTEQKRQEVQEYLEGYRSWLDLLISISDTIFDVIHPNDIGIVKDHFDELYRLVN